MQMEIKKKKAIENCPRSLYRFTDVSGSYVPHLYAHNSWGVSTNQLFCPCLGWKNNFGKNL